MYVIYLPILCSSCRVQSPSPWHRFATCFGPHSGFIKTFPPSRPNQQKKAAKKREKVQQLAVLLLVLFVVFLLPKSLFCLSLAWPYLHTYSLFMSIKEEEAKKPPHFWLFVSPIWLVVWPSIENFVIFFL